MNKYVRHAFVAVVVISLIRLEYNKDVITGLITGIPVGALLTMWKIGGTK